MDIYTIIGPIGSGKTEAQNILESLGYECYCADATINFLYTQENIIKDMHNLMPEFVLNNKVNTSAIRNIIFEDNKKRIKLENFIHPKVIDYFKKKIDSCEKTKIFFIFPITERNEFSKKYKSIYIDSEKNLRIDRIRKRKFFNDNLCKKIIKFQESIDIYKRNSDFIIENNETIEKLKFQIEKIIKLI